MTIDIQALIEQRPHLKDPIELYARWQQFQHMAAELLPKGRSAMSPEDSKAYPLEHAGPVFRLFVSIFNLPGEELAPLGWVPTFTILGYTLLVTFLINDPLKVYLVRKFRTER